jgi:anti-sigma B factor antagonist
MSRIVIKADQRPDGTRVVAPVGKLDVFSFMDLKRYFEELSSSNSSVMAVVDLSGVEYIASSGWSVLLSRRSAFRRQGGDLAICGMSDNLKRVYDTMKIDEMLPAADKLDEAVKLLSPA